MTWKINKSAFILLPVLLFFGISCSEKKQVVLKYQI